ncbi:MAG: chemotaxis protein CheW [Deltaproteobacteria bacterium]|nr:chemotaxis protein CheW [Deltaproteobacteria bacterium]
MDHDHQPLHLCTFLLDSHAFAIAVDQVQEVLNPQAMTRVPLAPPVVHGLINLRGEIVTAVDLRTRLSMPPRPAGKRPMNVVITSGDGPMSLLVDDIGDVIEVPWESCEDPPATLPPTLRDVVVTVCKRPDELLLVIDPARVAATAFVTSARS